MTATIITEPQEQQVLRLTGTPFVDCGLATIAALAGCNSIDELTLAKARAEHEDGKKLARNNMRLVANSMVFTNAITTQPSYQYEDRIKKYSAITTAFLNNIGLEDRQEYCDFCDSPRSVDLTKLVRENIDPDTEECFLGRGWFPLAGSLGSDAQALPGGSRGYNCCAKCLLAVQYLPQCAILVYGKLALFQSTSVKLWYSWIRRLVLDINERLSAGSGAAGSSNVKVLTFGKDAGSREVSTRLLSIIEDMKEGSEEEEEAESGNGIDINDHMIMYTYTNSGASPTTDKEFIPGFALSFLYKTQEEGLGDDALKLIARENKKTRYQNSFLKCISEGRDYLPLYPLVLGKKWQGASPGLFSLYQRYIRGYNQSILNTAYEIAEYIKNKNLDIEKTTANIERNIKKQNSIRKWIIEMVSGGLLSFNEYYDLFIRDPEDNRNPWKLIKYYLLNDREVELDSVTTDVDSSSSDEVYNKDYRDRVIKAGNEIYDLYLEEQGPDRLKKLLGKFAAGKIGNRWLRSWFEEAELDYDNRELDYQMVELFRVLFTERSGGHL